VFFLFSFDGQNGEVIEGGKRESKEKARKKKEKENRNKNRNRNENQPSIK
jgi:hypothetical protein